MLPAEHRLRRRPDFVRTVRAGRRAVQPALVGHLLTAPEGTTPTAARVGFVVSRAVGGAVQRNRVRRRLRHLMRERVAGLPAGTLLVVRASPAAGDLPGKDLAADLDRVLSRLTRTPRQRARLQ